MASKMASFSSSAPFSQAVVCAMRKLCGTQSQSQIRAGIILAVSAVAPLSSNETLRIIADLVARDGAVLLESPCSKPRRNHSVLLTVDLTRAVADEAIERGDSIIVAYHPIIFRGLKSLSLSNPQQDSLLRLAAKGISVYSPHTALDAAPGGMCDWLSEVVVADSPDPEHLMSAREKLFQSSVAIEPNPNPPTGFEGAGSGRLVTLSQPQPLRTLQDRVCRNLGRNALSIAIPQAKTVDDIKEIRTIAVCPGSGASLLMRNGKPLADLLVTGEMSHHDALAAIENGSCVITVFHSNSERGYVQEELLRRLRDELSSAWPKFRTSMVRSGGWSEDALGGDDFEIAFSRVDADPYQITK